MPTLDRIGKRAVLNHHRQVPYRLLHCDAKLSAGDADAGNLLVQGDNLEALKALLPYYAGKVKCIYIDPPFNSGEQKWTYNDHVDGPEIRRWLGKVVGAEAEDLSRHDKWLCMMYPRLTVLHELLSRDGIIAVSIDDNEVNYLGVVMDEVFGPRNRLACAPWLAEPSGGKQKTSLRSGHEYLLIYHNGDDTNLTREAKSAGGLDKRDRFGQYRKGRELLKWGEQSLRTDRPRMWFALRGPNGEQVYPIRNDGKEGRWRLGIDNPLMKRILDDPEHAHWEVRPFDEGVGVGGRSERLVPYQKVRDAKKSFGWSTWLDKFGHNADATRELKELFGNKLFSTPKPVQLVKWILSLHEDEDALVLDSFAGSGTTGDAVLRVNSEDGGNRRFILVEMVADVCESVTAERLRKLTVGYTRTDGTKVEGLGGGFRYCKLGEPLFDERGNIRESVRFAELAAHVFFTETGAPLPKRPRRRNGEAGDPHPGPLPERERGYSPLLGVHNGKAVYLLFNGVMGDKRPDGGNVLTSRVLAELPSPDPSLGGRGVEGGRRLVRVIYGEGCRRG